MNSTVSETQDRYIEYPRKKPEDIPTQDDLADVKSTHHSEYDELNEHLKSGETEVSDEVRAAISAAQEAIYTLAKKYNLPLPKDLEAFEVVMLQKKYFDVVVNAMGTQDLNPAAIAKYPLKKVIVLYDESLPATVLGSIVFHELVHRWIELHVTTYSVEDSFSKTGKFKFFTARNGLQLRVSANQSIGVVLNELSTCAMQTDFLNELLKMEPFELESMLHDSNCDDQMAVVSSANKNNEEETQNYQIFQTKLTTGEVLLFSRENTFFTVDGESLLYTDNNLAFLYSQVVENLDVICRLNNKGDFKETLIQAKINPKLQSKLRTMVEPLFKDDFKKGFFHELRNMPQDMDQIIDLLLITQKKRTAVQPWWTPVETK